LANAAVGFVGEVNFDAVGELGRLGDEHILGFLEDDGPPLARRDAAEDEDLLQIGRASCRERV